MANISSTANHMLRGFRAVWNHARRIHDLPECPMMAIEWYVEKPDGRIISDLFEWRTAIDALDNPIHTDFFYFILFTGFSKTEALTLEWKNVHSDYIHLPLTKNGRSFDLPITEVHHEILKPLKGIGRDWVFPSQKSPSGRLTSPGRLQWSPHRIAEHLQRWRWRLVY